MSFSSNLQMKTLKLIEIKSHTKVTDLQVLVRGDAFRTMGSLSSCFFYWFQKKIQKFICDMWFSLFILSLSLVFILVWLSSVLQPTTQGKYRICHYSSLSMPLFSESLPPTLRPQDLISVTMQRFLSFIEHHINKIIQHTTF